MQPAEPPEFTEIKQAMALSLRGMDRSFAAIDAAMVEIGQAKSDIAQAKTITAAIFNGPGPRAQLFASVYRSTVMESEDPRFLKAVLLDAWKKSDWAYTALATAAAGAPAGGPA